MTDAFIQVTLLIDHGARRTEEEARQIQWSLLAHAEELGVDNVFVEDTEARDD